MNGPGVSGIWIWSALRGLHCSNTIPKWVEHQDEWKEWIFVFGFVLCYSVELIAGWLLDVCFHARLVGLFR